MAEASESNVKSNVSYYKTRRKVAKTKVTKLINNAIAEDNPNVKVLEYVVNELLSEIASYDNSIIQGMLQINGDFDDELQKEAESQADYLTAVKCKLSEFDVKPDIATVNNVNSSKVNSSFSLPSLKCDTFTGEDTNYLDFHSFFTKFESVIGGRSDISDSIKLTYLKSFLKGYAYKVIKHLQINDRNYYTACSLLEKEFLDKDTVINDLISKLMSLKCKYDTSYLETKLFVNEAKCILSDLKHYDIDIMSETSGNTLVSHIIFNKLPMPFRQELIRKLSVQFPSVKQIFDNYVEIINLLKIRNDKPKLDNFNSSRKPIDKAVKYDKSLNVNNSRVESVKPNFVNNVNNAVKSCKLCNAGGHTMFHCKKYPNHQSRVDRCRDLNLCIYCSGNNHEASNCNQSLKYACTICSSKEHISALCSKFQCSTISNPCLSSSIHSGNTYLLPVITVNVGHGKQNAYIKCLLDTGSQRSYISNDVLKKLGSAANLKSHDLTINTFINSAVKSFKEICLSVDLDEGKRYSVPFLVHDNFNLGFTIDSLTEVSENINCKYKLREKFDSNEVHLDGLLGVDCIQYLQQMNLITCMGGKAFELRNGIIPFGNIDSFLYSSQLATKYARPSMSNESEPNCKYKYKDEDSSESCDFNSIVNFILHPVKTEFDPLGNIITDSSVEHNLDRMFSVESLGITEEISEYDEKHITEFNDKVKFDKGKYHVEMPWTDKIDEVRNNFHICKSSINKVVNKLYNEDLYNEYDKVLMQQVADDILEPVDLESINIKDHVWIPHRPVVKNCDQVTTKLRIVLNCSLKIGDSPSLNEAAYKGIDLVNNLLELLLKIRNGNYLVMSDIKQAFLMIKLSSVNDRNKFSILWINDKDELVAYRYKTIVFGYVSSPFILQNVIKLHLTKYPDDYCNYVLNNNLYVDNLFFTGNSLHDLTQMYKETFQRMNEGGFELRSWTTNCAELKDLINEDDRGVSHSGVYEKLLGYLYDPEKDKLRLADITYDNVFHTKRTVLSNIAKIFDPLGLTLPVTVRGKNFVNKLWKEGFDWDQPLNDLNSEWLKIQNDLLELSKLTFPRKAYDKDVSLYIFCDSSKSLYGFSCYAKCEDSTDLLFAKAKVAPTKSKSLPTLELLSVFLAMKCLPTIINSLNDSNVTDITIGVDAQIVLSWILTGKVKTKNIFASNRVKDINKYQKDVSDKFGLNIKFKYLPSEENPADLVTRGLSFKEFQGKLKFWLHGPEFLSHKVVQWPVKNLGCLSEEHKLLACNALVINEPPIIDCDKFSDINKLYRVTSYVFKFIDGCRKIKTSIQDQVNKAKLYWIHHIQNTNFKQEINFLRNPNDKDIPVNVNNLNLFLDDNSILRCHGRIDKSDLPYDIKYPVLLPKFSTFTDMIITDSHSRCKHLGIASTLNYLRKNGIWIPKGRARVKSVISKCILCKKINSFAFRYPRVTNYVRDKMNFKVPFEHTGIDYTGHVYIKQGDSLVKMYILVFTCLNIRAIHLELLPSLTCRDFLLAFIRFCNAYNMPSAIYSDNASTFLNAMKILGNSLIDNDFDSFLTKNNIKHIKIPLYSAWVGAAWERMIRTIKQCIAKITGRKHYNYFEYYTMLTDIQNCINSRPLTYLNDDSCDVITPNSFLKFTSGRSLLLGNVDLTVRSVPGQKELAESLGRRETLLEMFKQNWYDEYLLSLRENHKDIHQSAWKDSIHVGELVLINSPIKPRAQWSMGRVSELLMGSDNRTRCVKVVRGDGSEAVHSITHLYPLELSVLGSKIAKTIITDDVIQNEKPRRKAALRCLERIKRN